MINKRGLSAVITTLIIILLVIVAVGIIWVVVRNVIEEGATSIELSTKCLAVDTRATVVNGTTGTLYDVTLHRTAGGDDIGGVKLVFFNSTDNGGVIDSPGNIAPLGTVTRRGIDGEILNANKVEVTSYFTDASGIEQLCSQTIPFEF